MNHAFLREVEALRRLAGMYSRMRGGPDGAIYDAANRRIGECEDPALAVYLARVHNAFIGLVNLVLNLRRRLSDREAMTKEQNATQEPRGKA